MSADAYSMSAAARDATQCRWRGWDGRSRAWTHRGPCCTRPPGGCRTSSLLDVWTWCVHRWTRFPSGVGVATSSSHTESGTWRPRVRSFVGRFKKRPGLHARALDSSCSRSHDIPSRRTRRRSRENRSYSHSSLDGRNAFSPRRNSSRNWPSRVLCRTRRFPSVNTTGRGLVSCQPERPQFTKRPFVAPDESIVGYEVEGESGLEASHTLSRWRETHSGCSAIRSSPRGRRTRTCHSPDPGRAGTPSSRAGST